MPDFQDEDFFAPAADIARRIRERKLSAVAVVDALTERIKKHNSTLNAFVEIHLEENLEAARVDAKNKDTMLKQHPNMKIGPLYGVPVAIKDDLAVLGMPLTAGSRLCGTEKKDFPDYQDAAVTRLREAGAIILGKTHLPEFGHKGTTDNLLGPGGKRLVTVSPWDTTRTSGGSSGGSCAAVAAGMAYLALGTDIGGSVRIPASCCGVVGHKPTFGLVPRVPSGNAFSLWMIGPIARNTTDATLALRVLAGPHPKDRFCRPLDPDDTFDPTRPIPAGLKVAWYPKPTGFPVEPEVESLTLAALEKWAKATGAIVVSPKEPFLTRAEGDKFIATLLDAAAVDLLMYAMTMGKLKTRAEYDAAAEKLSPTFAEFAKTGWDMNLPKYLAAQEAITTFCETRAADRFADIDLIASPTLAVTPPHKDLPFGPDEVAGEMIPPHLGWCNTWPANLTGEPAVSVPAAWTKAGLPVGLQLTARRGFDGLALRVAASIEKAVPWADSRPKL